ncbi:MAG: GTP-binding protein, partial [Verrucomicrobiota bacterium]
LNLPDPMPAQHLLSWLDTLPDRVLRVKGLVRFAEEPERWYHFQCADGTRDTFKSRELRTQPKVLACAVLIGVNLDEQAIRDSLTKPETQEVSNAS